MKLEHYETVTKQLDTFGIRPGSVATQLNNKVKYLWYLTGIRSIPVVWPKHEVFQLGYLLRLGIPVISFLSHFLVNSRSKQLCVIEDVLLLRPSFSRSYRSILSSSLSRVYSITLVDLLLDHHCRFRVRFIFLCFFLSPSE